MTDDRDFLKAAVLAVLDATADEHAERHQASKAARYVLVSRHGVRVEIMFEKNPDSPANLWCLKTAAGSALIAAQRPTLSTASVLWTKRGKDGDLLYGRHSALERMGQLGGADLVCFKLTSMTYFGQIIDHLRDVTPAELI